MDTKYIITFLGKCDKNSPNWKLWNRFCDIFKNIGHQCKWINNFNEIIESDDNVFFTKSSDDTLKLIEINKANKNNIIFQKLEQNKIKNEDDNESWDFSSYENIRNLYNEGYNIYGFTNSLNIDGYPEKKEIIDEVDGRIFTINAGGLSFATNKINNCFPETDNLIKEINIINKNDDNNEYIDLLKKSDYKINYQEKFSYEQTKEKVGKYELCPIFHTDKEREQKILNENFYDVFISGRFGICDNMTAVEIFGEEIKDICTEDPEEYYKKSIYYLKHPEKQTKYITIIQNKIKEEINLNYELEKKIIFLNCVEYISNMHYTDVTIIITMKTFNNKIFNYNLGMYNKIINKFENNNSTVKILCVIDNDEKLDNYRFIELNRHFFILKLFYNKERIFARNIGAKYSKSDYIIFHDNDDIIEYYENIYELYLYNLNNNYNITYGQTNIINKNIIWKCPKKIDKKHYEHAHLCSSIIKKEFFMKNKFIDKFNRNINNYIWAGEDVLWFYNCVKSNNIIYNCNFVTYSYYQNGSSFENRILSLYERYENTKEYDCEYVDNFEKKFQKEFNCNNILDINLFLQLKRNNSINFCLENNLFTYNNIFIYSDILNKKETNIISRIFTWYFDYFCKNNNSACIILIDFTDLKNVFEQIYYISVLKISKYIYFINIQDNILFECDTLIILKENDLNNASSFIKKNIKYLNLKNYRINRKNQYTSSFYLKSTYELLSQKQIEKINIRSIENLNKIKKMNYTTSNVFFTGPSLNINENNDFKNSLNIAVNSFVKSDKYWNLTNPDIIFFSDPIFHSSCSKYTEKFYNDVNKKINSNNNLFVVTTIRDYNVVENNLINTENIIYLHFTHEETDLNKLKVKVTSNVATGFVFPVLDFLKTEMNNLYGFTGKPNIKDEKYFWKHSNEVQYEKEKNECKKLFPGFFNLSFEDYNNNHNKHVTEYLKKNKHRINIIGKTYYNYK